MKIHNLKCIHLHNNKRCDSSHVNRPCCYFCKDLVICIEKWKNEDSFCHITNNHRWCSKVRNFINKYGLPLLEEKVIFT